jgi:PAH dioxygenase small subunit
VAQWPADAQPVDDALYRRVCEFYYDEADLLASRRYVEWFALLAPDIAYRVAYPEFFEHGTRRQVGIGNPYFDDNHATLKIRVDMLADPLKTTAENPPSVFNYFVTNIRVRRATDEADALDADTRLLIYRVRATEPVPYILGARRRDRLRLTDGGFRIARREAAMDQAIIQSPNMSWLF